MARVKRGVAGRARHKKILKMAKGYRDRSHSCFRIAIERVEKGMQYAYRDRRNRKRDFRALWIQRINAAVRPHGLNYSKFMHALKASATGISSGLAQLNRKMLSEIAIRYPETFNAIVAQIKSAT